MLYSSILKWAAGSKTKLDPNINYDTRKLLELVDLHNLSGRFLFRIQKEKINWITPQLLKGLKDLHIDTRKKVMRNIRAFNELKDMLPKKTQIILIKGVSTYILCNQEEVMRAGDIDILSNDTSSVVRALVNAGYQQTKAPFLHEIGEYSKDGIEFDIHDHFPVYSYSSELRNADLISLNKVNIRHQSYSFASQPIAFSDLGRHAHHGKQPPLDSVVVTDPNLLAIIICAHAFMNYTNMWSISHRKKAYVRLSEIADLFSLSKHADFDTKKLLKYTRRYHAQDSVEWAASVSMSLFGENPLPVNINLKKGDLIPASRFPRCLWWNFWVGLPAKPDDLLFTNWMSIDKLTDYIEANEVVFGNDLKSSGWYSSMSKENLTMLKRYFTMNGKPILISLNFRHAKRSLVIEINIERTMKTSIDRVRVDLGKYATEWELDNIEKKVKMTGDKEFTSSYKQSSREYKIVFKIDLGKLEIDDMHGHQVSLLIGVAKHDNAGKIVASNLFPIQLSSMKI